MFKASIYKNRRSALAAKLDEGIILLLGNNDSPMNYRDNIYPFRQDSNFLYLIGIDQPELAAIIDVETGKTTLFGDDLPIDYIIWMGQQTPMADLAEASGIEDVRPVKELPDFLKKQKKIHYLPPYRGENVIRFSQLLGIPVGEVQDKVSEDLIKGIVAAASKKSKEELVEMEKAVNISVAMHRTVMQRAKPGMKEALLAGIAEGIALGCDTHLSYPIILSKNGQTLHNHYHGNTLAEGDLVLADMGAESRMHYAGDLTRTFPVAKRFTQQQKEIYQLVLDAQMQSIEILKPGVPYRDVHLFAAKVMATGLKELGLMKGDIDAAVAEGAHALFFPHGLGHMIGLDVHDMEDLGEDLVGYDDEIKRSDQFGLAYLRLAKRLEEGFVLTVEPGLYFIPELIDLWQSEGKFKDFIDYEKLTAYRNFGGVRIEDNIVITDKGHRILGNPLEKTVEEVEALRNSD